jgi:hypothetical protein
LSYKHIISDLDLEESVFVNIKMVRSLLLVAGLLSTAHGRVHELIVGNFANNVLYTLSFDDKTYNLDLIANISVATKNSWISFNVSLVISYSE